MSKATRKAKQVPGTRDERGRVLVNVAEAKTHFSALMKRVEAGEEIVVARDGKPVMRLVPEARPRRDWGSDRGKFTVPDDFNEPLEEFADYM